MVRTCPNCGSAEIDEDPARGDATCTHCGTVVEESIVVTENQFQERAGGSGHTLVGQFVSAERAAANNFNGMGTQESREVTYSKGRKVIEELGSQLRINSHCMNTAFNFFKMCVSRNLTRGRNRASVVAVCLYITCRLENTAHLLLDFSDVTQINVFDLGRNLNFISRSLRINLPSTDPCLYIMRFACVLDFGDKQKEVVNLATRLVQRMKRDWMSTGRRPTGICGAALLIAARSLNFNRSINDIVRVVHISESVIRKRLDEFSQTPSGSLTIDEFSTVDLEHNEDPPAYRDARRKAREDQLKKEAEQAESMKDQLGEMEKNVEAALDKKRKEKFSKSMYAKLVSEDLGLEKGADEMVRKEILETVFTAAEEGPCSSNAMQQFEQYRPSLESLGIKKPDHVDIFPNPAPQSNPTDADLDAEISDSEIDSYILTESEVAIKTDYWMKANGDVMKVIEERRREREENGDVKKKRRGPRKAEACTSVLNAMEKVIQEKKLSNKVNYEMLKDLETMASGSKRTSQDTPTTPALLTPTSSVATPDNLTKSEKMMRVRNLKTQSNGSNLETLRNVFDLKKEMSEEPAKKPVSVKVEEGTPTPPSKDPDVRVIGVKPAPGIASRSRYSKVKPIIGAKKLATLTEVKKVERPSPEPQTESTGESSEPAAPAAAEVPEQLAVPVELPATETPAKPDSTEPSKPTPSTSSEEVKSVVKSRYTKAKPIVKLGKTKAAPTTPAASSSSNSDAATSEPATKRTKTKQTVDST